MYYAPNTYSYPYYANMNTPVYYSGNMSRNYQDNYQPVIEAILGGIKREASAVELYTRLANKAPNQKHKGDHLRALAGKRALVTHFTNLYINLTGTQPVYQADQVPFRTYSDGLRIAFEKEVEGYEDYQRSCLLTQDPQVRHVFQWALAGEQENALRMEGLTGEVANHVTDYGPEPFVINIDEAAKQNNTFRTALWTGTHLQVTLMSIGVGEDIGLENHPTLDQFLRIEQGQGLVQMGDSRDQLDFEKEVYDDYAIVIPAGKWHNLTNTGNVPIKLYSIYAPPQHPYGTIHETKEIALAAEEDH